MIQLNSKKDCCGCYACATICPQQCIAMEEDQEGFRYPITDEKLCTDCHFCEQVCPVINRFAKSEYEPKVFACLNKNEKIRLKSSSGGVFTLLAEYIIQKKGVVFGARFDSDFSVIHDFTETLEGLAAFQGSKYLQSLIGDTYIKARQFLKQDREVLFTGTSCQIAGLKHFLRKEYSNLLTVDIVCHGVPSPKVFRLYLNELSLIQNGRLEKIQFRNKTEGWKKYSFVTKREDGKKSDNFRETADKNIYMRGFLQNLYLRPSCHTCPSKNFISGSDLTIADYWGIENILPDFDDDLGCSLLLCNNSIGHRVYQKINLELKVIETTFADALKGNPCIVSPVSPHHNREIFFEKLDHQQLSRLINRLTKQRVRERIKRKIFKFLGKIKRRL